jgi:aryl-alcohol dehydrogenase-like predicted oxidoreductase
VNVSNGNPSGGMGILAGRPVARLGYGAMQLSGPGGLTAPPRQMAISVLRRAAELGVNHIDTAHFYGAGLANELIRAALSRYPDGLVLVLSRRAAGCNRSPRWSPGCSGWPSWPLRSQ